MLGSEPILLFSSWYQSYKGFCSEIGDPTSLRSKREVFCKLCIQGVC